MLLLSAPGRAIQAGGAQVGPFLRPSRVSSTPKWAYTTQKGVISADLDAK